MDWKKASSFNKRSAIPILCKCKLCNHEWKAKPNNLLSGKGCPKCFHSTTSFVEEALYEALKIAVGEHAVVSRDRKMIGKELDIYLPEYRIAIEPGSWKWHEKKVKNDEEKRRKCHEKNIRLLTIYTDYPLEKAPFMTDCFVCKETIGFEGDLAMLKYMMEWVFANCGIKYCISNQEWKEISNQAYQNSKRVTTEEYKKRIAEKNPDIKLISDYTGSWNKVEVRCLKCGYNWSASANNLLLGVGCPKCARIRASNMLRMTTAEFLERMKEIAPHIRIQGAYKKNNEKVFCECEKCGHLWLATPSNLLQQKGCPKCSRKRAGEKKRKDPSVFAKQIKAMNPKVEVVGEYVDSKTKIFCRCHECGYEWFARPNSILRGRGCPQCAINTRNRKKYKRVMLVETGEVFESVNAAAAYVRAAPSLITAAITGKINTAKGRHWQYYTQMTSDTP